MPSVWERLQNAFIEDHRKMTRCYRELIDLLSGGDLTAATRAASRLDAIAGPHIEFEEKYLYRQVAKSRGNQYVSRLYDEHDDVLALLVEILAIAEEDRPDKKTIDGWIQRLQQGMDHASACGSILGELKLLSEDEQSKFLDGLTRLRDQGSRWSQLQPEQTSTP